MRGFRTHAVIVALILLTACADTPSTQSSSAQANVTPSHHGSKLASMGTATSVSSSRGSIGFVCAYSHRNSDDPIVFRGEPNKSHSHEYFGARGVSAASTWRDLESLPNTCESASDYSSYWVPSLLVQGEIVQPLNMALYLRTPDNAEPKNVSLPPNGLELISVRSGWTCGRTETPTATWKRCPASATTRLVLEYPDCWNGNDVRSDDHFSHVTQSVNGRCPQSHPVMLPQLVTEFRYDMHDAPRNVTPTLSSGSLAGVHGDMILSWNQAMLKVDIDACIVRQVTCALTWSTEYSD
jgi:hypothetical protein